VKNRNISFFFFAFCQQRSSERTRQGIFVIQIGQWRSLSPSAPACIPSQSLSLSSKRKEIPELLEIGIKMRLERTTTRMRLGQLLGKGFDELLAF